MAGGTPFVWTIVSTAPEALDWVQALRDRGVDARLGEEWPESGTTDVVVFVGDAPLDAGQGARIIDLPHVLAQGASPAAVAEYLIVRARAEHHDDRLFAMRASQRDVVAKVAHDLNNNIAVVRANAAFLQTSGPELLELADEFNEVSRQMEMMTADLLMMSELELGREPISREHVAIAPLVETAMADLAARFASRQVAVDVALPSDLLALGHAKKLRRVFALILGMRARVTRRTRLEVRGWSDGNHVTVTVADGGVGVLPEERAQVFDPPSEANAKRWRELGSLGVSLYLLRLIAEAHGGSVSMVDLHPFTCCFQVVLPAAPQLAVSRTPENH